jgi:hypothetical protein
MHRGDRAATIAATALARALLLAGGPAGRHDRPRIDSIVAACATAGDVVAITGDGLVARGVTITVGGVPAPVVAAAGHRVTFVAPRGVPLGPTIVHVVGAPDTATVTIAADAAVQASVTIESPRWRTPCPRGRRRWR